MNCLDQNIKKNAGWDKIEKVVVAFVYLALRCFPSKCLARVSGDSRTWATRAEAELRNEGRLCLILQNKFKAILSPKKKPDIA